MSAAPLRIATRGSELARWQADRVAALLGVEVEIVVVSTTGDRRTDVPLSELGGRGVFVKEVQQAVIDGRADIAVHSAKDLPSAPELQPTGLVLAAFPERADVRDALVGSTLDALPPGALVGTGSPRRLAQLAHARPDLTFAGLRGNIATRLARVGSVDAVVVAAAALDRLGRGNEASELLDVAQFVPQVGQGALAVECRDDDVRARSALASIDDPSVRVAVEAERAFLAALGGGCDLPVGAHATLDTDGVSLTGLIASPDGRVVLRRKATGPDPALLGAAVAASLLDGAGAREMFSVVP
ncbi:MAG TPA: hydroxymethylbilane synthase [Acidimicrobiales bacterium]|nr:hydroxymethylbilane synthase [Acidimicrobiales bacterium]